MVFVCGIIEAMIVIVKIITDIGVVCTICRNHAVSAVREILIDKNLARVLGDAGAVCGDDRERRKSFQLSQLDFRVQQNKG